MHTKVYKLTKTSADDETIYREAASLIRSGKLVAFPTETVYGLGCNAFDGQAALKVFEAKGRPADNPLIVHVAFPADASEVFAATPLFWKIAEAFMPGPLTVILPKKDVIPNEVTAGNATVAVRCPSHPIAHHLIMVAGVPIAAPSANRSGSPSPTTAGHVLTDMDGRIPLILDGGPCDIGLESTVIQLEGDSCVILRPGAVTKEMLETVCAEVKVSRAVVSPSSVKGNVPSPGMKYKHYSPSAEVLLVNAGRFKFVSFVNSAASPGDAVFSYSEDVGRFRKDLIVLDYGSVSDIETQSRNLYALLRETDEKGAPRVFVRRPKQSGKQLALFNRLIRAAGSRVLNVN